MQVYNVKGVSLHLVALLPTAFFKDRGRLWSQKQYMRYKRHIKLKPNHFYQVASVRQSDDRFPQSIDIINEKGGDVLLETLLGGGGGAIRGGQRHQAVAAPQVGLQSFLIGRLQALEELLRLPTKVTVKAPVTPVAVEQEEGGKKHNHQDILCLSLIFNRLDQKLVGGTYFLARDRASASASWIPFFIVSIKTVPCL